MNNIELRTRVLLAMQVALLGAVTKDIRAVLCRWTSAKIQVRVIFDHVVTDDDIESMSEAQTEICSHFVDMNVTMICVSSSDALEIPFQTNEVAVFRRKE